MLKRRCHLKSTPHPLIEGFPVCHLMWVNMQGNGWSEGVKCWLGCAYWCANEQWMIIFIHFPCLNDEQSVATRWVDLLFSTRLAPNAESLDNSIFTVEVSWWMERGEVVDGKKWAKRWIPNTPPQSGGARDILPWKISMEPTNQYKSPI